MSNYSENQKKNRKKPFYLYVKWRNVALATICLTLIFVLIYELLDSHEFNVISNKPVSSKESEDTSNSKVEIEIYPTSNSLLSEEEFNHLVLAVQRQVGKSEEFFPNNNFDEIQQSVASVIINRIGNEKFGKKLDDILSQFDGLLDDIMVNEQLDVDDERTRKNCLDVLNGKSILENSDKLLYAQAFEDSQEEACKKMQEDNYPAKLILYYQFRNKYGDYLIIAGDG